MDARTAVGVPGGKVPPLTAARTVASLHLRVLRRRLGFTLAFLLLPTAIAVAVHVVCGSVTGLATVSSAGGLSYASRAGATMPPRPLPEDADAEIVRPGAGRPGATIDPDDLPLSRIRGDGGAPRAGHVFFSPAGDAGVVAAMRELAGEDPGLDYDAHFAGFESLDDMVEAAVAARKSDIASAPVVLISRSEIPAGQTVGRYSIAYYNSSRVYVRPVPDDPFAFLPQDNRYIWPRGYPYNTSPPSVKQLSYLLGAWGLPPDKRTIDVGVPEVGSDLNPSSAVEFSILVRLLRARVRVITRAKGLPDVSLRARVRAAPVRRIPRVVNSASRSLGYYSRPATSVVETDALATIADYLPLFLAIAMFTHTLQIVSFGIEHKSTRELGLLRQSRVSDGAYVLSLAITFLPLMFFSMLLMTAVLMPTPLVSTSGRYFAVIWLSLLFADVTALGTALLIISFFQRPLTANMAVFVSGVLSWGLLFVFAEDYTGSSYFYGYRSSRSGEVLTESHWIVHVLFFLFAPGSMLGAAFSSLTYGSRSSVSAGSVIGGASGLYAVVWAWCMLVGAGVFRALLAWYFLGVRAGTSRANGAPSRHWLACLGAKLKAPRASEETARASGYNDAFGHILRESEGGCIVAREIGKVFPGKTSTTALRDVSVTVRSDCVTALLGENGSGKTTLLSILTGQAVATSGSLAAFGHDALENPSALRSHVGICPQEDTALNEHLTPWEVLDAHARLRGIPADKRESVIAAILVAMHLRKASVRNARIGTLTGGQRRRLSIGLACLGDPKISFFDEPGAPLDPRNRRAVYKFLREISRDRGVVFTTHLIPDAEWADEVAVMGESRLRAHGSPARLKEMYGAGYTLRVVLAPSVSRGRAREVQEKLLRAMPSASVLESAFRDDRSRRGRDGRRLVDDASANETRTQASTRGRGSRGAVTVSNAITLTIPRVAARSHVPIAVAQIAELRASGILELWDLSHATLEEVVVRVAAAGNVNAQAHFELERRIAEDAAAREAVADLSAAPRLAPVEAAKGGPPMCKACSERPAAAVDMLTLRGITVRVEGVLCAECGRPPSPESTPNSTPVSTPVSSRSSSPRSSDDEDDGGRSISISSGGSASGDDDGGSGLCTSDAPLDIPPLVAGATGPSPSPSSRCASGSTCEDDGMGESGIAAGRAPVEGDDGGVPRRELGRPRVIRALLGRAWSRQLKSRKVLACQILIPAIVYVIVGVTSLRGDPARVYNYSGISSNYGFDSLVSYFSAPRNGPTSIVRHILRGPDLSRVAPGHIADITRTAPGLWSLGYLSSRRSGEGACEGGALYNAPVRVSMSPSAGGAAAVNGTWLRRFWDHSPVSAFGGPTIDGWICPVRGTGCPECGDWDEPADARAVLKNVELSQPWPYYRVKTFSDVQLSAPDSGDDGDDEIAEQRLANEMLAQQDDVATSITTPCFTGSRFFDENYYCRDDAGETPVARRVSRLAVRVRRETANEVDFTIVAPHLRSYMVMNHGVNLDRDESTVTLVEDSVYGTLRSILGVQSAAVLPYAYITLLAFLGGHSDPDVRRLYTEQATLPLAVEEFSTRPASWDTAAEMPPLSFTGSTENPEYTNNVHEAATEGWDAPFSEGGPQFSPHVTSSIAIGALLFVALAPLPSIVSAAASEMEGHIADMVRLAGVSTRSYWLAHHIFSVMFSMVTLLPIVALSLGFDIPPFGPGHDTVYTGMAGVVPVFLILTCAHGLSGLSATLAVLLRSRQRAGVCSMLLVPLTISYSVVLNVASLGSIPWWTTVFPPFAFARGVHEIYSSGQPDIDPGAWVCVSVLAVEGVVYLAFAAFVAAVRRTARDTGIESSEAIAVVIGGGFGRCVGALWHALGAPLRPLARLISPDKPAPFDDATRAALIDNDSDDDGDLEAGRRPMGGAEVMAEAAHVDGALHGAAAGMGGNNAALISNIEKTYLPSGKRALRGVSIGVRKGEVLGLLGPNGAGKSTIVKILTRVIRPDGAGADSGRDGGAPSGPRVLVDGVDVLGGDLRKLYPIIGVQPQHNAVWDELTVEENIMFYCRVRGVPRQLEKIATLDAASEVGLSGHEFTKPASALSGGQKRMLTLAIATVGSPSLLILDEPTAAISVNGRHRAWEVISRAAKGRSALVLTHIMEEASALANRVAIIARGEVIRIGAPLELQNRFCSGFKLSLQPHCGPDVDDPAAVEEAIVGLVGRIAPEARPMETASSGLDFFIPLADGLSAEESSSAIRSLINEVATGPAGRELVEEWSVSQPTLEDVFLRVIGEGEDDHH